MAFWIITGGLRHSEDLEFLSGLWWIYAAVCLFLTLFAGLMSGLTLGLMSMSPVDLEVLKRSGTPIQKKQAAKIFPVVQRQHQLLALPIFLDKMVNPVLAVILSVTLVLAFGEVIPQAVCTRYGLAIGASCVWVVRFLMYACWIISWPISQLLDFLLGHNEAIFKRGQLKALISIHNAEEGHGGELSHDETTIISGALDLTTKILARGHSRVPVFDENPKNIIGVLLVRIPAVLSPSQAPPLSSALAAARGARPVKSLLTVKPEDETPVSAVSIRRIPSRGKPWGLGPGDGASDGNHGSGAGQDGSSSSGGGLQQGEEGGGGALDSVREAYAGFVGLFTTDRGKKAWQDAAEEEAQRLVAAAGAGTGGSGGAGRGGDLEKGLVAPGQHTAATAAAAAEQREAAARARGPALAAAAAAAGVMAKGLERGSSRTEEEEGGRVTTVEELELPVGQQEMLGGEATSGLVPHAETWKRHGKGGNTSVGWAISTAPRDELAVGIITLED
eukprot:jgi/Mesen1/398/ME000010S_10859